MALPRCLRLVACVSAPSLTLPASAPEDGQATLFATATRWTPTVSTLGDCEYCCYERLHTTLCDDVLSFLLGARLGVELLLMWYICAYILRNFLVTNHSPVAAPLPIPGA